MFLRRNILNRKDSPIRTQNVDRKSAETNAIATIVADAVAPKSKRDAVRLLEWARDREFDALRAYYLVGVSLYNGDVKASELADAYGRSFLSKMRKVAKTVDTSREFARLYTGGHFTSFTDAYEACGDFVGKQATARVRYYEDYAKQEADLLAKLAEVRKAMAKAPHKPVQAKKKSK